MGNTPAHISYNASSDLIKEAALAGEDQVRTCIIIIMICDWASLFFYSKTFDPFEESRRRRIVERHDDYHLRQLRHMMISPVRADPFFEGKHKVNVLIINVHVYVWQGEYNYLNVVMDTFIIIINY